MLTTENTEDTQRTPSKAMNGLYASDTFHLLDGCLLSTGCNFTEPSVLSFSVYATRCVSSLSSVVNRYLMRLPSFLTLTVWLYA